MDNGTKKINDKWVGVQPGSILLEGRLEGNPKASEATAFNTKTGRAYTPKGTRAAKQAVAWTIKGMSSQWPINHSDIKEYGVQVVFYRSNYQKIDVDNMLKILFDGITRSGFWKDDSRVTEVLGRVIKGHKDPHTDFVIYTCDTAGRLNECDNVEYTKNPPCLHCGHPVSDSFRSSRRKFCSKECAYRHKAVKLVCPECNGEFYVAKSRAPKRKFCSLECSRKHWSKHGSKKAGSARTCEICGLSLIHI